jgi:hypothetical protein
MAGRRPKAARARIPLGRRRCPGRSVLTRSPIDVTEVKFAIRVLHLDPVTRQARPVGRAQPFRDDAFEAHFAGLRRYPREVRSLERQADRASKLRDKLRAKIDRTRAYTFAGLAIKGQVAAIEGEEDTQFADTTLESILRDLRKLNPAAPRQASS